MNEEILLLISEKINKLSTQDPILNISRKGLSTLLIEYKSGKTTIISFDDLAQKNIQDERLSRIEENASDMKLSYADQVSRLDKLSKQSQEQTNVIQSLAQEDTIISVLKGDSYNLIVTYKSGKTSDISFGDLVTKTEFNSRFDAVNEDLSSIRGLDLIANIERTSPNTLKIEYKSGKISEISFNDLIPKSIRGASGSDGSDGRDGKDGKDGEIIESITLDQREHIIVKTNNRQFDLGRLPERRIRTGGGGGPNTFRYTNETPMPNQVGGIPAGTTFDEIALKELFDNLLYAYDDPFFSDFYVDGITTPREVGDTLPAGTYQAYWTLDNLELFDPASLVIKYGATILASGFSNTGQVAITMPAVASNIASTKTFTIQGTTIYGIVFSKTYSFSFQHRIYFGEDISPTITPTGAKLLRFNTLATTLDGEYAMEPGGYKYFVAPFDFGLNTKFFDADTNIAIAMAPTEGFALLNNFGIYISYFVYRTYNQLNGSINIRIE